jgi:hypothetical protein
MPEAPMAAPAPAQDGGAEEAISQAGSTLSKLVEDPGLPEEAKAAFKAALEAFSAGVSALTGGGSGPQPEQGVVTPEQGASGAVPMSHGGPR